MTALTTIKTASPPLHQAVVTLPFTAIQQTSFPLPHSSQLHCVSFLVSSTCSRWRETKSNWVCSSSPPWQTFLPVLLHSPGQDFIALWAILFISQQSQWMIFNSLPAWERTKASLCGRVALNGYKWDLPIFPEASYEITVLVNLTHKCSCARTPEGRTNCSLLQDNTLSIRMLCSEFKDTPSHIPPRSSEE